MPLNRRIPAQIAPGVRVISLEPLGLASDAVKHAGRISPWLSAVAHPDGTLLTVDDNALLRVFAPDSFRLVASCSLAQPASACALDARRGLLYTAGSYSEFTVPAPLGERLRGLGELLVYDVRDILAGKGPAKKPLIPLWTLSLEGAVLGMHLSATGTALAALVATPYRSALVQIDTDKRILAQSLHLPNGVGGITQATDASELYVNAPGRLTVVNPESFKLRREIILSGAFSFLAPGTDGVIFLGERNQGTDITALDTRTGLIIGQWKVRLPGRLAMTSSPDGSRLFLSNTTVTGGQLWVLDVRGKELREPSIIAAAKSDADGLLRGGSYVTPAGAFLLNAHGRIFRLQALPRTSDG